MTKTRVGKTTIRETQGPGEKGRPVIVSIDFPNVVGFRLKGMRKVYFTTAEACWWMAAKAEIARKQAEKRKAKKGRNRNAGY